LVVLAPEVRTLLVEASAVALPTIPRSRIPAAVRLVVSGPVAVAGTICHVNDWLFQTMLFNSVGLEPLIRAMPAICAVD
jgi:hypothetical protein